MITISKQKQIIVLLLIFMFGSFISCKTVYSTYQKQSIDSKSNWIMLPSVNLSENSMSDKKAVSILSTLLRAKGIEITTDIVSNDGKDLLTIAKQNEAQSSLEWAKNKKYSYGMTLTVEEWKYKSGLDALPVVGITLKIIKIDTGDVIWSVSGAKTGMPRQSIAAVSQDVMKAMLDKLKIKS